MHRINKSVRACGLASVLAVVSIATAGCTGGGGDVNSSSAILPFVDHLKLHTIVATNVSKITYSNDDAFDLALHASMKGNTSAITVAMPTTDPVSLTEIQNATAANPGDERINRWMLRISDTEGTILACENKPEFGIWAFITMLANILMPKLNEYVTYKPANKYHAVAFYDESTKAVTQVKMIKRNTVNADTLDCAKADAL